MGAHFVTRLEFAVFLLLVLYGITCSGQYVKAAIGRECIFLCTDSDGNEERTNSWDYAVDVLGTDGGTIRLQKDYVLKYPGMEHALPDKINFIIPKDVEFYVSGVTFRVKGNIIVYGKFILQEGAVLRGDGDVVTVGDGVFQKAPYSVGKKGEICLTGTDIEEGQTLAESDVFAENVLWSAEVPGTWSFAEPQSVPEAGTGTFDVLFTPDDLFTYEARRFESCGQVTVMKKPEPVAEASAGAQSLVTGGGALTGYSESGIFGSQPDGSADVRDERVVVVTKMVSTPSNLASTVSKSFKRKKTSFRRVKRRGRKVFLRWKKVSGADGYQIQCVSAKSNNKKTVKKGKKYLCRGCALTISKVSSKKNFYVRIRAYKKVKKQRTYTKWSSVKKAK